VNLLFRQYVVTLLALLVVGTTVMAAPVPVPALKSRVTDLTGTLNSGQCQQLEGTLQQFESTKGSQVVVLIVPSTGEETIEQFGIRVADVWKIGRQGVNDGAILLVAKNDRTLRIEVGRGLEGALPDATASRIINEIIVPFFKKGDFSGGIEAGVGRILKVIQGEPLPAPAAGMNRKNSKIGDFFPLLFIGVPIFFSFLGLLISRLLAGVIGGGIMGVATYLFTGALVMGLMIGVFFFVIIILIASAKGATGGIGSGGGGLSSGGGGWSSGSSSSGSFSGGGGSFGGGGASGRW
jgi:uncharacterized protein